VGGIGRHTADTVEDTPVPLKDIESSFGKRLAPIVEGASEPSKEDTWENRKRHRVKFLKAAPMDILLVSLGDKVDNIGAIR